MTEAAPKTFTIERRTVIAAPPKAIYPLIGDLHAWEGWSPWENVPGDHLAKTYSGAKKGVGSIYEWTGKKTGQGRMEITAAKASTLVEIDLRFLKPFKAQNASTFRLTPVGEGTEVVWTMIGKTTLISKVMGLFMNMDKMLGGSFATGLARMKAIAEGGA